jgi:hypothetical protein
MPWRGLGDEFEGAGLLECFLGSGLVRAEWLFELCPGLLDGVQVEHFRPGVFDPFAHPETWCELKLAITTSSGISAGAEHVFHVARPPLSP